VFSIESFCDSYGLVGVRTQDSAKDFKQPLVIAYYGVDYKKNAKGTCSKYKYMDGIFVRSSVIYIHPPVFV